MHGPGCAGHLTCVSGGSYIASTAILPTKRSADSTDKDEFPLYHHGPVEDFLRRNCRYMYEQPGRIWGVLGSVTIRLSLNLLLVTMPIFIAGYALGRIYHVAQASLDSYQAAILLIAGALAVTGILAGLLRVSRDWADEAKRHLGWVAWGGILAGAGGALLGALLPIWLGRIGQPIAASDPVGSSQGSPGGESWWNVTSWAGTATWAAIGSIVAVLMGSSASKGTPALLASDKVRDRIRRTVWKWRAPIANALALVAGPILLAAVAGISIVAGHSADFPGRADLAWVMSGFVVGLAWWQTDVVNWSLHPPYRDRLFSCFGATRGMNGVAAAKHTALSDVAPGKDHQVPHIKICAALNISTLAATPAGSHVLPWVFSPDVIGVPNKIPSLGKKKDAALSDSTTWETAKLETALKTSRDLAQRASLQSASAMAAAAVAPSMGRMTRAPLRMLMALFNVRLGVWVPNPMNQDQQARVLEICKAEKDNKEKRWRGRARPGYLFVELLGRNSIRRKWVYVTDGGHYENLGLVEALRNEEVRLVFCIDAAGDPPGKVGTLAQALALARSELDFEVIDGDLGVFELTDDSRNDKEPPFRCKATHGVFTLRKADRKHNVTVVAIRLGLTEQTPGDILDYARQHPRFPYDSTANQLYKADRFDAYRALGYASTNGALDDATVRHELQQIRKPTTARRNNISASGGAVKRASGSGRAATPRPRRNTSS